jgi:hypothetical protein
MSASAAAIQKCYPQKDERSIGKSRSEKNAISGGQDSNTAKMIGESEMPMFQLKGRLVQAKQASLDPQITTNQTSEQDAA